MSLEPLLTRLPALGRLLLRLGGLPPHLGEINFTTLRDVTCLDELTRLGDDPLALMDLVERSHRQAELTLPALGAAEMLQAMGEALPLPLREGSRAELGRLLITTGEVELGLEVLREITSQAGLASRAAWYLVHSFWRLDDPLRRRKLLEDLQTEGEQVSEVFRCACRIEHWWQTLRTGHARTPGLRYQLESFLQQATPAGDGGAQAVLRALALHCLACILAGQTSTVLLETAVFHLRAAIALYRTADLEGLARALDSLGQVLALLGQHEEAGHVFLESLELKQHLRDLRGVAATFHNMAQQRLAQGRPLHAADLLQSSLVLLPLLEAPHTEIKATQADLVLALLTAAFPLEEKPPSALPRLTAACLEFAEPPCGETNEARAWFFNAARRWLEARQIPDPALRRDRLHPAIRLLRESLSRAEGGSSPDDRARVALYLALALIDRAALTSGSESGQVLEQARTLLDQADQWLTDALLRPYLEWGFAQWAGVARRFDDRQAHLAAARHHAELLGNVLFQGVVDDSLNAHLASPILQCPAPLVLSPGGTLEVPLTLRDWRERRLPRFTLRVRITDEAGLVRIENGQPRTDEAGKTRLILHAGEGRGGRTGLEIRSRAGRPLANVALEVCDLEIEGWQAGAEDAFILRQLFGSGYQRLLVRRVFEGGLSGMQVLLVHPQMRAPIGSTSVWNGQPCIVKIGAIGPLTSEWERYQRWVRALLPANVTRMTRFVAWEDRAGILMGLVGTTWSRSRSEHDWLLDASPFDAHYLLEQIFHRDLGLSWYSNTGEDCPPAPLLSTYAWAVPPVWTLVDATPPGGLVSDAPPADVPRLDLLKGLHATGTPASEDVVVEGLTLVESRPHAEGWEHELAAPSGLRITFRSPLRAPETTGDRWCVRGQPQDCLAARLRHNLLSCCATWKQAFPHESAPEYDPERGELRLPLDDSMQTLPDPLVALGERFLTVSVWHSSVIHGDLHGRNVIVDSQGQPYYIDFAKTRPGPTLYDFLKHEIYLWHDLLARQWNVPLNQLLGWMFPLMERLRVAAHPLHRHSPGTPSERIPDWLATFEQSLQTLRVLGRAYVRHSTGQDFAIPYAALTVLMLRWCDPETTTGEERLLRARQGLIQAALASWTLQESNTPGSPALLT